MISVIRKAVTAAGGVNALAAAVGIRRQALYAWPRVPPKRVIAIEAATGGKVTRHEMRPDIYPVPVRRRQRAA